MNHNGGLTLCFWLWYKELSANYDGAEMKGAEPQKEFFMSKISFDFGSEFTKTSAIEIFAGCVEVLQDLGKLASVVEVFKVKAVFFNGDFGPDITVHMCDPLGSKDSFSADFRSIGRRTHKPTTKEISDFFRLNLENVIIKLVMESRRKSELTIQEMGNLLDKK